MISTVQWSGVTSICDGIINSSCGGIAIHFAKALLLIINKSSTKCHQLQAITFTVSCNDCGKNGWMEFDEFSWKCNVDDKSALLGVHWPLHTISYIKEILAWSEPPPPPPSWKCLDFVSSGSSLPYLFQCSTIKHVKRVCCDAHSKHYINFQMEKICWLICSNMGRSCWEYHFQQFTIFVSKVLEWIDEEQWCYYWHCWPNWRTDSLLWKAVFWKGDWLPTSGQTLPIEPVTHHWNWKGKRRFYNCSPFCYFPK